MESFYGVRITNRYQLFLNEDENPSEILEDHNQKLELKDKSKITLENDNHDKQQEIKVNPTFASRKEIKETRDIKLQDQQNKLNNLKTNGPTKTGGAESKFNARSREEQTNRRNQPEFKRKSFRGEKRPERRQSPAQDDRANQVRDDGGQGRGRGSRSGVNNRERRDCYRQSGSDITEVKALDKEDCRSHQKDSDQDAIKNVDGMNWPHNDSWGMGKKANIEVVPNEAYEKEKAEGGIGVRSGDGEPPSGVEERKILTLDEWKALKALKNNRSKPSYNLRKAGEGEDLFQWKNMYVLTKKKDEEDDDEEYYSTNYPQRVGRQKHILDIEFTFTNSQVGRVDRGVQRGGRVPRGNSESNASSSRDRGGERSQTRNIHIQGRQQNRQSAPRVDDEHDFPSLG